MSYSFSVLFSVFLLLQTAAPAAGVKLSGKIVREQIQVNQTQVRFREASFPAISFHIMPGPWITTWSGKRNWKRTRLKSYLAIW
jgi:hypothetical protein